MGRGVSPLIAWVLLVGFAIVMGAFIFSWATGTLEMLNIGESQELDLYCDNVGLEIESVCVDGLVDNAIVHAVVTNNGNYNIKKMTVSFSMGGRGSIRGLGFCYKDIKFPDHFGGDIEVGDTVNTKGQGYLVEIQNMLIGVTNPDLNDYKTWSKECGYPDPGAITPYDNDFPALTANYINYLAIVPWVDPTGSGESFPCSNKKIVVDADDGENDGGDRLFLNDYQEFGCPTGNIGG